MKNKKKKDQIQNIEKVRYIEIKNECDDILYKYSLSKIYNDHTSYNLLLLFLYSFQR